MPNSTSSASTSSSTSSPTPTSITSGSGFENKPEIVAQSMPIVSEIDDKKVTDAVIPETTAKIHQNKVAPHLVPYPGSKAAHVMVNSSGSGLTGSTLDEKKKDEPEEEHQARLVPRDLRNDSEKPEGPNEWAGYAHIRGKLPTLAPKPKHGTSASSMYRHLSRIGGSERTCDVCNKTFSDR